MIAKLCPAARTFVQSMATSYGCCQLDTSGPVTAVTAVTACAGGRASAEASSAVLTVVAVRTQRTFKYLCFCAVRRHVSCASWRTPYLRHASART